MPQKASIKQDSHSWKTFEKKVRLISSFIWSKQAIPENVAGVNFDCVIKQKDNYWILVEITEQNSLDKVRSDITKLAAARMSLFSRNIFAECYLVCLNTPTTSMRTTGNDSYVKVLDYREYENMFVDFEKYAGIRVQKAFGSAVNPNSGSPDHKRYTPVQYIDATNNHHVSLEDIIKYLTGGRRVVLLGNFGTGKSRCIRELFMKIFATKHDDLIYPVAINLKENWGVKHGMEIIQRHFNNLGLAEMANSVARLLSRNNLILLLDGFDEMGAQSWSDDSNRLKLIRSEALSGVKDLIKSHTGGMLITGREHYFSSHAEMFNCLGLDERETLLFQCRDEFTDEEMTDYLTDISKSISLPTWLPKRPLICQIIDKLESDKIDKIFIDSDGEIDFWHLLLDHICTREARINIALDAETIKRVYYRISRASRSKASDVGPLTISEINKCFEIVVGTPPVDESALILQRLPGLGRINSESSDRQFVDYYILDGLRAEDLICSVSERDYSILTERWLNPLGNLGLSRIADELSRTKDYASFYQFLDRALNATNDIIRGDIVAAISLGCSSNKDIEGKTISGTHISYLDFAKPSVTNLCFQDSYIDNLHILAMQPDRVSFNNCTIQNLYGVSSSKGLPEWLRNGNRIENYESVNTVSQIKNTSLSWPQKIFVTFLKKTFFQPGAGRKEEALLRGLDVERNKKLVYKILNKLCREGVFEVTPGNEGNVYIPNRKLTKRMDEMLTHLTLSKDPLWLEISAYKK